MGLYRQIRKYREETTPIERTHCFYFGIVSVILFQITSNIFSFYGGTATAISFVFVVAILFFNKDAEEIEKVRRILITITMIVLILVIFFFFEKTKQGGTLPIKELGYITGFLSFAYGLMAIFGHRPINPMQEKRIEQAE